MGSPRLDWDHAAARWAADDLDDNSTLGPDSPCAYHEEAVQETMVDGHDGVGATD